MVIAQLKTPPPEETAVRPGTSSSSGLELVSSAGVEEASDRELIAELRAGSRSAANRLVDLSYEMVYASLFKLTGGDVELAADLTQETYARAWRSLDSFAGRSRFSTWLYRIAYNTFLNHRRRPERVRTFDEGEEAAVQSSGPDPALSLAERREREQLRRAVLSLPDELRVVVSARYWGGLSVRQIAKMENLTTAGNSQAAEEGLRGARAGAGRDHRMSERDGSSSVEQRLQRDSVERERPVPPEGLAEDIKAAIPDDLLAGGSTGEIGSSWSPTRWAIAASLLAVVFAGLLAFRIGVRPPQAEETVVRGSDERALADPSLEQDRLSVDEADGLQKSKTASEVGSRPASDDLASRDLASRDLASETRGLLEETRKQSVAVEREEAAGLRPNDLDASDRLVGEVAEANKTMFLESEPASPESPSGRIVAGVESMEAESKEDASDVLLPGAAPSEARERPMRQERASRAPVEGWVDLFFARAESTALNERFDETFRDETELSESRQVVAGRTAVIEFSCSDAGSAERLRGGLRAQVAQDRALKLTESSVEATVVQLTEFRVWTRPAMVERLRELEALGADFSCALASLGSGDLDE